MHGSAWFVVGFVALASLAPREAWGEGPRPCASTAECARELCIDREAFFDEFERFYRRRWGSLDERTVCAIEQTLNFWETTSTPELTVTHPRSRRRRQRPEATAWLSYVMATALHETVGLFYPVREGWCPDEACTLRRLEAAFQAGRIPNRYWTPLEPGGARYYGRGQIQLTHRDNYAMVHRELDALGILVDRDLVRDPDAALDIDISVATLVLGMSGGWFRVDGRGEPASLGRYLARRQLRFRRRAAYRNARNIVNGDARRRQEGRRIGNLVAEYALDIEPAIHFVEPPDGPPDRGSRDSGRRRSPIDLEGA